MDRMDGMLGCGCLDFCGGLVDLGWLSEPQIALIFVMGFDWEVVGGRVCGDGGVGCLVGGGCLNWD